MLPKVSIEMLPDEAAVNLYQAVRKPVLLVGAPHIQLKTGSLASCVKLVIVVISPPGMGSVVAVLQLLLAASMANGVSKLSGAAGSKSTGCHT